MVTSHLSQQPEWTLFNLESQRQAIFQRVHRLASRGSKGLGDRFKEELFPYLLVCSREFLLLRSANHASRIIRAFYVCKQNVLNGVRLHPNGRHVRVKLIRTELSYPFGSKPVLGLVIGVNAIEDFELLAERHICSCIHECLPGVQFIRDSFFSYQKRGDSVRVIYLEIGKERAERFSPDELKALHAHLPKELPLRIERLNHSLFMPRNEEEVFRNIVAMSQQLQNRGDIPHFTVSFQEQTGSKLTFNGILLRLIQDDSALSSQLLEKIAGEMAVRIDEERAVGRLGELSKLATVFTLTFDKAPFLRKNSAVDLRKARQYATSLLEEAFGECRDFNGGLLIKQSEVLGTVKGMLSARGISRDFLLENLYYSITPSDIQNSVDPGVLQEWFLLVLDALEINAEETGYAYRRGHVRGWECLVVRADDPSFRPALQQAMSTFGADSVKLATSFLKIEGTYCLGVLFFSSGANEGDRFAFELQRAMERWKRSQKEPGALRINVVDIGPSLDPRIGADAHRRLGSDRRSGVLVKMLYDGLMQFDRDGKVALGIAEKVDISSDYKKYTFHLRDSSWSNGQPVTAHDFAYAWKRQLHPKFHSHRIQLFYPIKNVEKARSGIVPIDDVGIHVEDDNKLVVELEYFAPYFLELTAHWIYSPVYPELAEQKPDWAYARDDTYVCNGPFKLTSKQPKTGLILEKNPTYWDAKNVSIPKIDVVGVEDPDSVLTLFEEGRLDWIGEPLSDIPKRAISYLSEKRVLQHMKAQSVGWVWFNTNYYPFSSKSVRKAFAVSLDYERMKQRALLADEAISRSFVPPNLGLVTDGVNRYDLEMGRQLFHQGIKELGMAKADFPKLELHYPVRDNQEAICTEIAEQWSEAFGVEVTPMGYPPATYLESMLAGRYQISMAPMFPWFNDPICLFEAFRAAGSSFNLSRWENEEFAVLLAQSNQCLNVAKRRSLHRKLEAILLEECPAIPLYTHPSRYLKSDQLRGLSITDVGQVNFKWASLEGPD